MIAGKYGVKNLQRIMENIEAWGTKPNEDYSLLIIDLLKFLVSLLDI